ncbi:MAG: class I SAM-dependent RNA methyltransferase [Halanaerobiales bacterium]
MLELIASSTFGLESIVKDELWKLGFEIINVENGQISFRADFYGLAKANLWLRCAERVFLKMGEFPARDFDELYDNTRNLPWEEWLPVNANFPVTGKSVKSVLHSVPACQSIIKKAIVDRLKDKYRKDWFEEDGPLYPVYFALYKDRITLSINTSGEGLHKRGYRELSAEAPLQETLAAAILYLSRWQPDRILIDPFCGSGTIPVEAALMGRNIAPGIQRRFVAEEWPQLGKKIWQEARAEAKALEIDDPGFRLLMGSDIDPQVIKIARHHAKKAGVDDCIHFQTASFEDFQSSRKYVCIITNPPYGERLSDRKEVEKLYRLMGRKLLPQDTWSFYILTSHPDFERLFGKRASKRRKLYNGGIECQFYQYYGPLPPANKE